MKTTKAAVLVAVLVLAAGCIVPKPLKTSVGDGSWEAGYNIKPGTWSTANAGPHTPATQCEWTVVKASNIGSVLLRGVDTDSAVQTAYVGEHEILKTSNCGPWGWLSKDNLS